MAVYIERTTWFPGPSITIDCPYCLGAKIPSDTYDLVTEILFLGILPIQRVKSTRLVCSSCRTELESRVGAWDLSALDPEELATVIRPYVSFIQKSLALIALVFAIFPVIGTVMALVALLGNWKVRGWPKTLSWVALAISLAVIAAFGIAVMTAGH